MTEWLNNEVAWKVERGSNNNAGSFDLKNLIALSQFRQQSIFISYHQSNLLRTYQSLCISKENVWKLDEFKDGRILLENHQEDI